MWAAPLAFLSARPETALWFAAAVITWAIFNLQDSALTGLGSAVLVPVKSLAYSLAKICLVATDAGGFPARSPAAECVWGYSLSRCALVALGPRRGALV